nr:hypothetical protein [Brevibacillus laterosporus]
MDKDNKNGGKEIGIVHVQDNLQEKKGSDLHPRAFLVTCFLFVVLLTLQYA